MNEVALTVERIGASSNTIVTNLFDYYLHDMAEWFLLEVEPDGRYHYDFAKHWQRGDEVYLARIDGRLAGFAIVGSGKPWIGDPASHDVEEFFVLRRYRRTGAGEALARAIWALHSGTWLVRVYEGNLPAIPFWRKIISRYTGDRHIEERRIVNGKAWSFFHLKSHTPDSRPEATGASA